MKRTVFLTILTLSIVIGLNAEVQQRATIAWIALEHSAAEPFIFGNTIDDIIMVNHMLDLDGRQVRYLQERVPVTINPAIMREMLRLNARFMSIPIVQWRLVETAAGSDIVTFFIVNVYEQAGGRLYRIATSR